MIQNKDLRYMQPGVRPDVVSNTVGGFYRCLMTKCLRSSPM